MRLDIAYAILALMVLAAAVGAGLLLRSARESRHLMDGGHPRRRNRRPLRR